MAANGENSSGDRRTVVSSLAVERSRGLPLHYLHRAFVPGRADVEGSTGSHMKVRGGDAKKRRARQQHAIEH